IEDGPAATLDRHADLRARHVDVPREHGGGTDRAAAVVYLRLRKEERVLALDAARAHVVAAGECDDLPARVRKDCELRLRHVPRGILAHADLAAVRHHAPARGLEEELRPVTFVDVFVDRLLRRLLEARLPAAEVRDSRRPDLL